MAFALMDDQIQGHPKFVKAGLDAIGLWTLCLSYCSAYLTDGFVAREVAERYAGHRLDRLAKRLVACGGPGKPGLWEIVDGGWRMHDYLDWNPSRDEVLLKREAERERKNRGRKKQGRDEAGRITSERIPSGHPADVHKESERIPLGRTTDTRVDSDRSPTGSHAHAHAPEEDLGVARARVEERRLLEAWTEVGFPGLPRLGALREAIQSLPADQWPSAGGEALFMQAARSYRAAMLEHRHINIPAIPEKLAEPKHFGNIVEVMLGRLPLDQLGEPHRRARQHDLTRGQVPIANDIDYAQQGAKP